jgi:hypothetical protein
MKSKMSTFEYWNSTELEVIDYVTDHLLKQNTESMYNNVCMYRHPDGLMCAAGCLIPNDMYDPSMEAILWEMLVNEFGMPTNHLLLIEELQYIHDYFNPNHWSARLSELRNKYAKGNLS